MFVGLDGPCGGVPSYTSQIQKALEQREQRRGSSISLGNFLHVKDEVHPDRDRLSQGAFETSSNMLQLLGSCWNLVENGHGVQV